MTALTTFLTDTELLLVASGVAFVAGVVLSQRVKDAVSGVPSEVRTALGAAETSTLQTLKKNQTDLLAKLIPASVKAPAPAAAPTPVAAAPSPAPVAANGSTDHGNSANAPGHTA